MATLYNKTALKKIKKDDLIQMFMEQQAKLNDSHLATDVADHDNKLYDVIRKLKAENEKLKKRIEEDHKAVPSFLIQDMYHDSKEENKKLKEENKKLKEQLKEPKELFLYKAKVKELRDEIKELKEENIKLKEKITCLESDSYNEVSQAEHDDAMEEYEEAIETRDDQIKELKQQVDYAYKQLNELMSKVTLLSTD